MAKKIRFSLEMREGVMVGSIEALRENFSLPQVLMYLSNGKLITWLRDRYEDDIADSIEQLDKEDPELEKKICNIFDVEYSAQNEIDLEKAMERDRKIKMLKEYTSEQKFIDHLDQVAFTQDDLYDLLDKGESEVYLCGERFSIPSGKFNMKYYGINKPTVMVHSKSRVDWEQKNILLINVKFDENYQSLIEAESIPSDAMKEEKIRKKYLVFTEINSHGERRNMINDPRIIYLVNEKLEHEITVSEEAFGVQEFKSKIYYMTIRDDGCRELHIYDMDDRTDIIDHAFRNAWVYDLRACNDRWIACCAKDRKISMYDLDKENFYELEGSCSGEEIIAENHIYCYGGSRKYIWKYNLSTMEKSLIPFTHPDNNMIGFMKEKGYLLCLYYTESKYYLDIIDYNTGELVIPYRIEDGHIPSSDKRIWNCVYYEGRIYYICKANVGFGGFQICSYNLDTRETIILEQDPTSLYYSKPFLTINNRILYCRAEKDPLSNRDNSRYITKMIELPETEETFDINRIIERDQHCVFGVKRVSEDLPLTITEISDKYAGDKFTKIAETGEKYVYSYYQNSNDGKIHLSISRKMDYGKGIDPDIDYMLKTNKKKADAYNIISRYYMGEVVVYAVFAYLSGQDPLNEGLKEEYKYCANMICRGLGLKEMYKMKELDTKDQRDYDVEVCDKKRPILTRTMMERALRGCPVKGLELKNERDE